MIGVFFNGVLHPLRPDRQYRECGLLGYFENKKENRPALLEARQCAEGFHEFTVTGQEGI
tara:strand:+ start:457 stop:636 length:180 start_codon:yes stop_codon:yes gene_type:complete